MTAATATARPLPLDARAIDDLVARVDAIVPPLAARVVGFVASGTGEGTSTLARGYARANAGKLGRNTLLLSTLPATDGSPSLCDVLRSGQAIDSVLGHKQRGLTEAALGLGLDHEDQPDYAWDLVTRRDLWDFLRSRFDLIVLDMPAADVSGACLQIGPLCDGVLVVLESARTRKPVVTQLLEDLQAVHVRVLGAVLNKRSFHLPARLYRWL